MVERSEPLSNPTRSVAATYPYKSTRNPRLSRGPSVRSVSALLLFVLVSAYMVEASYLADAFISGLTRSCFILMLVFSVAGAALCVFRGRFLPTVVASLLVSFLAIQHWVFCKVTQAEPNYNALASFSPLILFTAFAAFSNSTKQVLRIFLYVSLSYVFIYDLLHSTLLNLAINSGVHAALGADTTRSERLYLIAPAAAFVIFSGIRDRTLPSYARWFCFGSGIVALYLAQSRAMQVIIIITLTFALFKRGPRLMSLLYAVTFLGLTATNLYGLLDTEWNPFTSMNFDSSAAARSDEYERGIHLLYNTSALGPIWQTGLGIPPDELSLQAAVEKSNLYRFYPADLGALGIVVMFGIFGLIVFVCLSIFMMFKFNNYGSDSLSSLGLTCAAISLYGVLAPTIVLDTGMILVSLLAFASYNEGRTKKLSRKANFASARLRRDTAPISNNVDQVLYNNV